MNVQKAHWSMWNFTTWFNSYWRATAVSNKTKWSSQSYLTCWRKTYTCRARTIYLGFRLTLYFTYSDHFNKHAVNLGNKLLNKPCYPLQTKHQTCNQFLHCVHLLCCVTTFHWWAWPHLRITAVSDDFCIPKKYIEDSQIQVFMFREVIDKKL